MHVDLSQLEEGTTTIDFVDPPESYTVKNPALQFVRPIAIHILITKAGNHLIISGNATTLMQSTCSRCLEPIEYPLNTEFTTELRPLPANITEPVAGSNKKKTKKYELEDSEPEEQEIGEGDVTYYTSELFALSEETRQYLELSIPMQPLCKEDCLGLCPRCGANLNKGKCSCPLIEQDHPFAGLKQKIKINQ